MDALADFDAVVQAGSLGDVAAIECLWVRHQPALIGWLMSISPDASEDVASEAWIDVMRCLASFRGNESQFRSWLFTIARRRLIDRQRRWRKRPDRFGHNRKEPFTAEDASFRMVRNAETQAAISQIVLSLPKDQAEVILLRIVGGLSPDQVAAVIGKPVGTVRVMQCRGLRRLALLLGAGTGNRLKTFSEEV